MRPNLFLVFCAPVSLELAVLMRCTLSCLALGPNDLAMQLRACGQNGMKAIPEGLMSVL